MITSNLTPEQQISIARDKVNAAKQQLAQAQGALATHTANMQTGFGVSTIEEADALLATLRLDLENAKKALAESLSLMNTILANAGV